MRLNRGFRMIAMHAITLSLIGNYSAQDFLIFTGALIFYSIKYMYIWVNDGSQ